jgi:lysosomal alpha-mannosidase
MKQGILALFGLNAVNAVDPNKSDTRTTIHIVPHSHCDLGWQNTIDGYFYKSEVSGAEGFTEKMGSVKMIITNVVNALLQNPERKFAWAEMKYFKMWWDF